MQTIVFLDHATFAPQVTLPTPSFAHSMTEYDQTAPDQVAARGADATIVITNKVVLTAEALARMPNLKLVAVAATGTDCVDKNYCKAHGIAVTNVRGYAVNTVPEHALALILALQRNLVAYRQDVIAGEWQKSSQFCFFNHPIHDLSGRRLGIIGEGVLGQGVADLARAFGMIPMFAAHKGSAGMGPLYTPWDQVLETSDVISLHSPLIPATRGMIAMAEFRQMKRKPLIINTSRGGLVVEADLERALEEGLISGAGFDVAVQEPPPADGVIMRIARRPNVIVTPHIAWASDEAQQALIDSCFDNIENFVVGRPTNLVSGDF